MSNPITMLVAFDDPSPSFVNGFEAGMIWQRLDSGSIDPIDLGYNSGFPAHTANVEVIRRMAQARGFRMETKPESEEGWTPVLLTYVWEGRVKPSLRLVEAPTPSGAAEALAAPSSDGGE